MSNRKWPEPNKKDGRFFCPIEGCDHDFAQEKGYASQRGYRKHCKNYHNLDKSQSKNELEKAQREKIEREEEGNKSKVRSKSHKIKTLDDLLEVAEVDLDVWKVSRYKVNKWAVGAKHPDTGEIVTEPLFQVKATLKRKVVEKQEFPAIQPVVINSNIKELETDTDKELKSAVVIPDSQNGYMKDMETGELTPFHNRKCWDLAIKLIKEVKPETVVLLGDMLDMAEWTLKYQRKPQMFFTTQAALIELNWWLAKIRKIVPEAEIIYLEGNHEDRLSRALMENMKAAYMLKKADEVESDPMLSVPNMLGLDDLNIEYRGDYPNNEYWLNENAVCHHGDSVSSVPGKTAGNAVKDARATMIFGHSHRLEMASKTIYAIKGDVTYRAISLGTFAKIGGKTPGKKEKQNWQNAVGVVKYKEGNDIFEIYPLFIQHNHLIWNDKVFEGESRLDEMKQDIDWEEFNLDEQTIR